MTLPERIKLAYEAVEEAERARDSLLMAENALREPELIGKSEAMEAQAAEAALRAVKLLESIARDRNSR